VLLTMLVTSAHQHDVRQLYLKVLPNFNVWLHIHAACFLAIQYNPTATRSRHVCQQ
jgi:hypothetical protein